MVARSWPQPAPLALAPSPVPPPGPTPAPSGLLRLKPSEPSWLPPEAPEPPEPPGLTWALWQPASDATVRTASEMAAHTGGATGHLWEWGMASIVAGPAWVATPRPAPSARLRPARAVGLDPEFPPF